MRKREVRSLYRAACEAYRQGIVDAAKYAGHERAARFARFDWEDKPTRYAYDAGWDDARSGEVRDAIRLDAWEKVLAVAMKRWAFAGRWDGPQW